MFNQKDMIEDFQEISKKLVKGFDILTQLDEIDVGTTPKEAVYREDKMVLYRYHRVKREVSPIPLLITYALVNRQYMMDIQNDRSIIKNLLKQGTDIYIIDWGYPDRKDRYLTMEDYIDGYMNNCVDFIRKKHRLKAINLLGVCQGGTFSAIYSALYAEKVKNLVTMVTPIDFDTEDGLLNIWARHMDIDLMVDSYGNIPGDFMNLGFLMLKPFMLMLHKYVNFMDFIDNDEAVKNFMRMEKWIFDSPDQTGEAFRKFVKELYQENRLAKGTFTLGGRPVDLKKISMPLLNIYAEQDHLVPPSSSIPLNDLAGSKDKELIAFPGGHIGLYVSSQTQKTLAPAVYKWLSERSQSDSRHTSGTKTKTDKILSKKESKTIKKESPPVNKNNRATSKDNSVDSKDDSAVSKDDKAVKKDDQTVSV